MTNDTISDSRLPDSVVQAWADMEPGETVVAKAAQSMAREILAIRQRPADAALPRLREWAITRAKREEGGDSYARARWQILRELHDEIDAAIASSPPPEPKQWTREGSNLVREDRTDKETVLRFRPAPPPEPQPRAYSDTEIERVILDTLNGDPPDAIDRLRAMLRGVTKPPEPQQPATARAVAELEASANEVLVRIASSDIKSADYKDVAKLFNKRLAALRSESAEPQQPRAGASGEPEFDGKLTGVGEIALERESQRMKWSDSHDDEHAGGEIAYAAFELLAAYMGNEHQFDTGFKPHNHWGLVEKHKHPRKRLVIAGALIAAELDRRTRAAINKAVGKMGAPQREAVAEAGGATCEDVLQARERETMLDDQWREIKSLREERDAAIAERNSACEELNEIAVAIGVRKIAAVEKATLRAVENELSWLRAATPATSEARAAEVESWGKRVTERYDNTRNFLLDAGQLDEALRLMRSPPPSPAPDGRLAMLMAWLLKWIKEAKAANERHPTSELYAKGYRDGISWGCETVRREIYRLDATPASAPSGDAKLRALRGELELEDWTDLLPGECWDRCRDAIDRLLSPPGNAAPGGA